MAQARRLAAASQQHRIATMLIRKPNDIPSSEITPRSLYLHRREFIRAASGAAIGAVGALALPWEDGVSAQTGANKLPNIAKSPLSLSAADEKVNSYKDITTYNNFYEFGTDKDE